MGEFVVEPTVVTEVATSESDVEPELKWYIFTCDGATFIKMILIITTIKFIREPARFKTVITQLNFTKY